MKTRILVAAIGLPILLVILLVPTPIPTAAAVTLLSVIGVYEMLYNTKLVRHLRLLLWSCLMAIGVCVWSAAGMPAVLGRVLVLAFVGALFGEMLAAHTKL